MIAATGRQIAAIVLDLEGTMTPTSFVYEALIPYARDQVAAFLEHHRTDEAVLRDLRGLLAERARDAAAGHAPPPWQDELPSLEVQSATAYVHWLMARDRESAPLRSLQGKIWSLGLRRGRLTGLVYDDVAPAVRRWTAAGKRVCTFSATSAATQRLLLSRNEAGDLAPMFEAHFDAGTGAQREVDSYRRIADALALPPGRMLYLSDLEAELDAASDAGLHTVLCVRPGAEARAEPGHPRIRSFGEVPG
jgi:enolase-phosphatase E1